MSDLKQINHPPSLSDEYTIITSGSDTLPAEESTGAQKNEPEKEKPANLNVENFVFVGSNSEKTSAKETSQSTTTSTTTATTEDQGMHTGSDADRDTASSGEDAVNEAIRRRKITARKAAIQFYRLIHQPKIDPVETIIRRIENDHLTPKITQLVRLWKLNEVTTASKELYSALWRYGALKAFRQLSEKGGPGEWILLGVYGLHLRFRRTLRQVMERLEEHEREEQRAGAEIDSDYVKPIIDYSSNQADLNQGGELRIMEFLRDLDSFAFMKKNNSGGYVAI